MLDIALVNDHKELNLLRGSEHDLFVTELQHLWHIQRSELRTYEKSLGLRV